MNECPQGTCDGVEGIKDKMLTKKLFMWVIGFIILALFSLAAIAGKNQVDIGKVQTHYEHIQKDLKEIKDSQLTKGDIYKAIRRAITNKDE